MTLHHVAPIAAANGHGQMRLGEEGKGSRIRD